MQNIFISNEDELKEMPTETTTHQDKQRMTQSFFFRRILAPF